MTKHTLSAHSALTAIAAGLALASTPALAQVTDPAPAEAASTPILVPSAQPAPAMPGPVTTVALPQAAAPVATQAAPTMAAVAPTLPEIAPQRTVRADTAQARRIAPAQSRPVQTEARTRPIAPLQSVTPAPAEPTSTVPNIPLVDPATIQQSAQPAPAPATATTEPSGAEALWVVGGAGAALLVGIGALVFMRRRDREQLAEAAVTTRAPITSKDPKPFFATPGFSVAPEAASSRAATSPESALDTAAAPAWSPATASTLARDEHADDLEAMVAQAPTADNPFLTRRKRLRRATFLLEKGHAPGGFADTPRPREAAAPVKEAAHQPVYNFANGPVSFRPQGWKPAMT